MKPSSVSVEVVKSCIKNRSRSVRFGTGTSEIRHRDLRTFVAGIYRLRIQIRHRDENSSSEPTKIRHWDRKQFVTPGAHSLRHGNSSPGPYSLCGKKKPRPPVHTSTHTHTCRRGTGLDFVSPLGHGDARTRVRKFNKHLLRLSSKDVIPEISSHPV
jgi:hypothetical protein